MQPGYGAAAAASAPLPEQSTQILADALIAKTSPPKPARRRRRDARAQRSGAGELPAQPTVILEGGTGAHALPAAPPGVLYSNPQAATMSAMPAVPPPSSGPLAPQRPSSSVILSETSPPYRHAARSSAVSGVRNPSTGSVMAPPPYAHGGRSTLWKDIAIGVGVAVAVVAGVLGARAMLSHGGARARWW